MTNHNETNADSFNFDEWIAPFYEMGTPENAKQEHGIDVPDGIHKSIVAQFLLVNHVHPESYLSKEKEFYKKLVFGNDMAKVWTAISTRCNKDRQVWLISKLLLTGFIGMDAIEKQPPSDREKLAVEMSRYARKLADFIEASPGIVKDPLQSYTYFHPGWNQVLIEGVDDNIPSLLRRIEKEITDRLEKPFYVIRPGNRDSKANYFVRIAHKVFIDELGQPLWDTIKYLVNELFDTNFTKEEITKKV